jgi:L-lactate dehydrogenase complex protein LldE
MKVELFIPCFIDQFYPETARKMIHLLKRAGIDPVYHPEQTCCGQLFFNSGHIRQARKAARIFTGFFSTNAYIVSPGASCTGYIRSQFKSFLKENDESDSFVPIGNRIFEFTDFLVNVLKIEGFGGVFPHSVTYHDACSALREYGLKDEPRILLRSVRELRLIEMEDRQVCCGFGGTFSVKHEPVSVAMVSAKVSGALKTGAEYITSTEASCLMNIGGYIQKNHLPIKPIHIVDLLAAGT